MCHFGSVYRRFLYVGSPLFRGNVVILPSCYLSCFDSCARVSVDCSCARVPVGLWTARPVCPRARVPVCPWIPRVPECPCARGFLVCPCARVPVNRSRACVPVCPEAREETYLEVLVKLYGPVQGPGPHPYHTPVPYLRSIPV